MKALIFDSGTLINLSMNGLLYILEELKRNFNGKFLITQSVKNEVVDRPKNIQRFELGALNIENLLTKKIIEMPESLEIDLKIIEQRTNELLIKANHFIQVKNQWVRIVSDAEMSCLALSSELSEKDIENIIAIDERTTRILCEDPKALERQMSEKLHQRVSILSEDKNYFSKYKFIRSSELVFVAYKKEIINLKGKRVLEALLYATKFKGAAISFEEIEQIKKL